jgi:hypothetical protein
MYPYFAGHRLFGRDFPTKASRERKIPELRKERSLFAVAKAVRERVRSAHCAAILTAQCSILPGSRDIDSQALHNDRAY